MKINALGMEIILNYWKDNYSNQMLWREVHRKTPRFDLQLSYTTSYNASFH